jgi:hypothetical protein
MSYMQRHGIASIDVKATTQASYNQRIQYRLKDSVWNSGGCRSWYLDPDSGKNVILWPGFTWQFRQQTRCFDESAYQMTGLADSAMISQPAGASV